MRVNNYIGAVVVCLLMAFMQPQKKKISLWLLGDSTMCLYEPSRAPLTGWGMPFANFFDTSVIIKNEAKGGRSTRTFLSENRWKRIEENLQGGDYVFIQFGHNDEAKEEKYKDRYTPVEDYKTNLMKFITEAAAKKAIPVLVTPVTRMRFDKQGNVEETHALYSAAVTEVAKQYNVTVIDLDLKSRALLHQMGVRDSKLLFMQLDSAVNPIYPKGQKDNTHFNEYGARRIAELVLAEVRIKLPELAERIIVQPVKK